MLVQDGEIYRKSTAALRIARRLDGLCPALAHVRQARLKKAQYTVSTGTPNR
jgi:hypothetical protein